MPNKALKNWLALANYETMNGKK